MNSGRVVAVLGLVGAVAAFSAWAGKPVTVRGALNGYDKKSWVMDFGVGTESLKVKFVPGVTTVMGPDGKTVDLDHAVNQSDDLTYDPQTMKAISLHCMEQ